MMLSFFFTAMDLNGLLQCGASEMMRVPSQAGVAAVQHLHGNVLLHRRQNRGRVQHLGAEVRQLRRFLKADFFHAQRVRADARIGGHDAVYVGPDLDGLRVQRAAHQSAREVGAAAPQRSRQSRLVRSDEPAHHRHFALAHQRQQLLRRTFFNDVVQRRRPLKFGIGDDELARVRMRRVDAALAESRGHNAAGDALAVAHNQIGDARRKLANRRQPAQHLVERVEFLIDQRDQRGARRPCSSPVRRRCRDGASAAAS